MMNEEASTIIMGKHVASSTVRQSDMRCEGSRDSVRSRRGGETVNANVSRAFQKFAHVICYPSEFSQI